MKIIFYSNFKILLAVFLALFSFVLFAQDPHRFDKEVQTFIEMVPERTNQNNLIIFTGSSSIRFWGSLESDFPEHNILNTGFGGSQFSDLIFFAHDLILRFRPKQVFIYEGDNDLAYKKDPNEIMDDALALVKKLRSELPKVDIVFIAAKPSIARWKLKDSYVELNNQLSDYASKNDNIQFVDIWTPMVGEDGVLESDLFIEDQLHMTPKGYEIWKKEVIEYLIKD
jgi:hypothetical protein